MGNSWIMGIEAFSFPEGVDIHGPVQNFRSVVSRLSQKTSANAKLNQAPTIDPVQGHMHGNIDTSNWWLRNFRGLIN